MVAGSNRPRLDANPKVKNMAGLIAGVLEEEGGVSSISGSGTV